MIINWEPPEKRNARINQYKIEINGRATYRDFNGKIKTENLMQFTEHTDITNNFFHKSQLPPNTNYTVSSIITLNLIKVHFSTFFTCIIFFRFEYHVKHELDFMEMKL